MKKLIFFTLVQLLVGLSFGQTKLIPNRAYIFTRLDMNEPDRQYFMEDIIKDKTGFMWFASRDGLYRYDGKSYKLFQSNPNDEYALKSNAINGLCLDKENRLWIISDNYLYRYDEVNERFISFELPSSQDGSEGNNLMSRITADEQNNIWVATWDRALFRFDTKNSKFIHYDKKVFGTNTVKNVYVDRMNTIWICTHNGLYVYNPIKDLVEEFLFLRKQSPSKAFTELNNISEDKNGILWIGSNNGIIRFDRLSASIKFYPIVLTSIQIDRNVVQSFYDDGNDQLWVGTRDGMFIFSKSKQKITYALFGNRKDPNDLLSSDVRVLYDDKMGNVWIGSHNGGINKWNLSSTKFKTIVIDSEEIGDNRISSIYQTNPNELWYGSENGLYLYNFITRTLKSFNTIPLLRGVLVKSIAEDNAGNLLIGTDKDGLILLNPKTLKAELLLSSNDKSLSYSNNDIWDIFYDSNGKVWICKSGNGLVCFNPLDKSIVTYRNDPKNTNSISSNTTGCITEDYQGRFWIGTSAQGLNCYSPKTGKFQRFIAHKNDSNSIADNRISYLHFQGKNHLWIGTQNGLDLMDIDKNTIKHFGKADGLDVQNIRSIVDDANGNLWVATSRGLFKKAKSSLRFVKYTTSDGLPSDQFISAAVYKNKSGVIFMGTEAGLVYFNPALIPTNKNIPSLVFTNFKLFNKDVSIGDYLEQSIVQTKAIELGYKDNFIELEFAALDYCNPHKNKYSWYLEGLETTWNNPTDENVAVYNNLSPGRYTLRIKASNNDEIWTKELYELTIVITPPFYETLWFRILIIVLIIVIIAVYNNFRISKITSQKMELEELVKRRTQTVNNQKLELESVNLNLLEQKEEISSQAEQLKVINDSLLEHQEKIQKQTLRLQELDKVKTRFFENISHELRTPLTLIIGPLEKLQTETASEIIQKQCEMMLRNAHRLLRLINQLLDLSSIDGGQIKLHVTKGDATSYIQNICETFNTRADRQNISYSFEFSDENIQGYFDWDKIEKIVYNIISNAFKYTPDGGMIQVKLARHQSQLDKFPTLDKVSMMRITFSDTGLGIPENLKDQIFERFYRLENANANVTPGAGIGLSLTRELVQCHYGKITVESEQGNGSEFIVDIPIDERCFTANELSESPNVNIESNLNALQLIESFSQKPTAKKIEKEPEMEEMDNELPLLLIIEDDKDLNEFLSTHFSSEYKVVSALNGNEGLNTALEIMPDMILSDVMLPGQDGLSIARTLKGDERTSHIPIIILTAKDAENEKAKGLETGVDDYITKPFAINILELKIRNLIDQRKKLLDRFSKIVTLQPTNIAVNKTDEYFLQKSMDIIERYMENPTFDVEIFTREIGISRTLLYRKVRALTNQSINDFIRSVRLKRAAQLLQSGDFNVSEAAMRTGFTNQSYFSKCFEQQFGELPSRYASKYKL